MRITPRVCTSVLSSLTCNNTAYDGIREPNAVAFSSYCERSEPHVRVGWRNSLVYIYIFVSMGRPFGPAWAPRNAQRANVGPAGLGSMVNVIALKTATLVLSRG